MQTRRERSTWKFLRTENDITTGQAAADLDVHQATISRWENGTRTPDTHADAERCRTWLHQRLLAYYRWNVLHSAVLRDACPRFAAEPNNTPPSKNSGAAAATTTNIAAPDNSPNTRR